MTGWWGYPGQESYGKVHVVRKLEGTNLCGSPMGEGAQFQFCAAGIHEEYLSCKRCQAALPKIRKALEVL